MQLFRRLLPGGLPKLDLETVIGDALVAVALPPASGFAAALRTAGARDVLLIERSGPADARRLDSHATVAYESKRSAYANNCQAVILHGASAAALMSPKTLARFRTILLPRGVALAIALPALVRHVRRKRVSLAGEVTLSVSGRARRYLVLESLVVPTDNRRQFGTAGLSALDVIRRLDGLDYVVVRWPEKIADGTHEGDVDILVARGDATKLVARFAETVATYPLDIYSDDGSGGFTFNKAPYYTPRMAEAMLRSAATTDAGIRVPDARWRYLSFAYHLMLHIKSRRVPPGTTALGPDTFRSPKYFAELTRLAAAAGEPAPATFDDIEAALKRADAWPAIDLMGFYAEKNRFLKHRYFEHSKYPPGLMTVFVRDFGLGAEPVERIRAFLARKFDIVAEGPVTDTMHDTVLKSVRGGNWSDPTAPGGEARPVHWFVCWDSNPAAPKRRTRRKQPRIDNEHVNLKYEIREHVGVKARKQQRLIHTSDNTAEALEHVHALGCEDTLAAYPAWRALGLS